MSFVNQIPVRYSGRSQAGNEFSVELSAFNYERDELFCSISNCLSRNCVDTMQLIGKKGLLFGLDYDSVARCLLYADYSDGSTFTNLNKRSGYRYFELSQFNPCATGVSGEYFILVGDMGCSTSKLRQIIEFAVCNDVSLYLVFDIKWNSSNLLDCKIVEVRYKPDSNDVNITSSLFGLEEVCNEIIG